jgi:hypothetical protein
MQKTLNAEQISAFYHDVFVQQQVEHFKSIALPSIEVGKVVVDIGGGCGYFAGAVKKLDILTRVIDIDLISVETAQKLGLEVMIGNALQPPKKGDEGVVCFNLILHHLVANSEAETLELQARAISVWKKDNIKIFINEYIYESWIANFSGWVIYQITKNKFLSAIGKIVSKVIPSLKANTFGVGVRFRSSREWIKIFEKSGFIVKDNLKGQPEFVSLPRRMLLIKEIRRDSFVLVSR